MRKVLYIFGLLSDDDVAWMAETGTVQSLGDGTTLIRQGSQLDKVYILIEGHMTVSIEGLGTVAQLGAGEMLGEMSFVDGSPTSATVAARGTVKFLQLNKQDLETRFAADPSFGFRFFKALSVFLADRLRGTVKRLGYGGSSGDLDSDEILEDEIDETLLDTVSIAGERFDRMIQTLSGARKG
jgi:CRP-like cAMP-binding protein